MGVVASKYTDNYSHYLIIYYKNLKKVKQRLKILVVFFDL